MFSLQEKKGVDPLSCSATEPVLDQASQEICKHVLQERVSMCLLEGDSSSAQVKLYPVMYL